MINENSNLAADPAPPAHPLKSARFLTAAFWQIGGECARKLAETWWSACAQSFACPTLPACHVLYTPLVEQGRAWCGVFRERTRAKQGPADRAGCRQRKCPGHNSSGGRQPAPLSVRRQVAANRRENVAESPLPAPTSQLAVAGAASASPGSAVHAMPCRTAPRRRSGRRLSLADLSCSHTRALERARGTVAS